MSQTLVEPIRLPRSFLSPAPSHVHVRGQALAEFAVALLALSPLWLLVPMVGKYADVAQTTEIASRYVAFEALAHDPLNGELHDDRVSADTARRFFSRSDVPIRTGEDPSNAVGERNMLWSDHAGNPLLLDLTRDIAAKTKAGTRDPFPGARAWWHALDLRDRNLITGSVQVQLAHLPQLPPFDALNLRMSRQTALLVDDWSALGSSDVKRRIEGAPALYPTAKLDELLRFIGMAPRLLTDEPMKPGLPDWQVVPCDRLESSC